MSSSLPSPPAQEPFDPSSPSASAPPPPPLLAPIPQSTAEASTGSSLLITPTPSTAPPPPLPVTATPPSAPHPGDDPASSVIEGTSAAAGIVDEGEVGSMDVEPASAPPPPLPPSVPSASSSSATPAGTPSAAPFVPPPPPPPRVDPTVALANFIATMQRRGNRGDTPGMRNAAAEFARTEVRTNQVSPFDVYYLVPLILFDLSLPDISVAISTLHAWVHKQHYASGNPIYYQLATFISAVKTKTHSMIWETARKIDEIIAQAPQNEFDAASSTIAQYLFGFVKSNVRNRNLVVVAELYETIPVAEFQRYTGWSREEALDHAQTHSYGFDAASDLLSPVPTPKQLRTPTTTQHNFNALAKGILQVEMKV